MFSTAQMMYNHDGTFVLCERRMPMTAQEKLIRYIHDLTDEEADIIISSVKESASLEEVFLHHLPSNSPQGR